MDTQVDLKRLKPGPFKMGWILVMFDLPVGTKREMKAASQFRKSLLQDGYSMIQFSIYMRACVDHERMKKHADRLKHFAPAGGNIQALFITDKQWEKAITIIGEEYGRRRRINRPEMPSLFEFW